jgi:hypothetical protein
LLQILEIIVQYDLVILLRVSGLVHRALVGILHGFGRMGDLIQGGVVVPGELYEVLFGCNDLISVCFL